MHDESLDDFEKQLSELRPLGAPSELRHEVLGSIHKELTAARWDRRLGRVAVVLLAVGIGLNLTIALTLPPRAGRAQLAGGPSQAALVDAGVTVAEATDTETGQRFAQHLAIMAGMELTPEEVAAIDVAIAEHFSRSAEHPGQKG